MKFRKSLRLMYRLACLMTLALKMFAQSTDIDEESRREDPGARGRQWLKMRVNERGEIPPNALVNAKAEMDQMKIAQMSQLKKSSVRSPEDAGIAGWEWLGPGNIGGRIRSILVHPTVPSTMWVGSVSGGIWRTDNSGASWYPVDDFMANLAITSIVMDPTDQNILYASTGEGFGNYDKIPGAGIFKSIDGGVTWYQLPSTRAWQYVQRLVHHPDSSNVLLAVNDYTLWKTTDGGTYWFPLLNLAKQGTDVAYHPHFPNNVMVGTYGDVYYSSDYGTTFTKQTTGGAKLPTDGGRCEVAFAPSTLLAIYVSMDRNKGEVWRGSFGGATWTLMKTGSNYLGDQGWYANPIWVDPFDPDIVVIGGLGAARSTDGGSTWVDCKPLHADVHAIVNHPGYNGTSNRTVYLGDDGGIQVTSDIRSVISVEGWTSLNNNLGITQFSGGAASPDGSIIVGGTQDNSQDHFRPAWGVNGWSRAAYGDGGFSAVNYANPNIIFGEYTNLLIYRSTDGGVTYGSKTVGLLDAANGNLAQFIAPFSMDPNDPGILVGGGKRIWRTTNSGDSWSQIRDSIPSRQFCSAIDIAAGNSNIIWAGYATGDSKIYNGGGVVSYTTNAGSSWTDVDADLPNRYITDIAINPSNSDEVIVTIGGYANDNVWLTTNSGASWTNRTGSAPFNLPNIQVNTVRYHPENTDWIYVGTDLGVFASEDKGLHWKITSLYGQNEGPANVATYELFWQGNEYLIAATHGRGMFRARIMQDVYVGVTAGGTEDGSQQFPFHLIQDAINAGGPGSNIIINPGNYLQAPLTFYKRGKVIAPAGNVVIH